MSTIDNEITVHQLDQGLLCLSLCLIEAPHGVAAANLTAKYVSKHGTTYEAKLGEDEICALMPWRSWCESICIQPYMAVVPRISHGPGTICAEFVVDSDAVQLELKQVGASPRMATVTPKAVVLHPLDPVSVRVSSELKEASVARLAEIVERYKMTPVLMPNVAPLGHTNLSHLERQMLVGSSVPSEGSLPPLDGKVGILDGKVAPEEGKVCACGPTIASLQEDLATVARMVVMPKLLMDWGVDRHEDAARDVARCVEFSNFKFEEHWNELEEKILEPDDHAGDQILVLAEFSSDLRRWLMSHSKRLYSVLIWVYFRTHAEEVAERLSALIKLRVVPPAQLTRPYNTPHPASDLLLDVFDYQAKMYRRASGSDMRFRELREALRAAIPR